MVPKRRFTHLDQSLPIAVGLFEIGIEASVANRLAETLKLKAKITTLEELNNTPENKLIMVPGIGKKKLTLLRELLKVSKIGASVIQYGEIQQRLVHTGMSVIMAAKICQALQTSLQVNTLDQLEQTDGLVILRTPRIDITSFRSLQKVCSKAPWSKVLI